MFYKTWCRSLSFKINKSIYKSPLDCCCTYYGKKHRFAFASTTYSSIKCSTERFTRTTTYNTIIIIDYSTELRSLKQKRSITPISYGTASSTNRAKITAPSNDCLSVYPNRCDCSYSHRCCRLSYVVSFAPPPSLLFFKLFEMRVVDSVLLFFINNIFLFYYNFIIFVIVVYYYYPHVL